MTGTTSSRPGQPDLSVSMIVRNEARRLPGFLDALGELADEVCITDTGSEDETLAIARSRGCRVGSFPWCGDFAAARNAALQLCTGRWILSLDADEVIAREDHAALRALLQGPRDRCYRFVTRNYTDEATTSGFVWALSDYTHALGFRGWFPSSKVRLFPHVPGARFEGRVHELIHTSLEGQGVFVADTAIPVHHYPLLNQSEEGRARKQALYLALGLEKVSAHPEDGHARQELGDQYVDLGDYVQALACYREAVRLEPGNPDWLRALGSVLLLLGQLPQAEQALELSLRLAPNSEEGWRNLGVARARREDWSSAREAFTRAHGLNPTHPEGLRSLAIAASACGDRDGAIALLDRLLALYPTHVEARALHEALKADR